MKCDLRTYRTVAEEVGGKKADRAAASWRIRGGGFWPDGPKEALLLVPDFEVGHISAVREADWEGSVPAGALADLDAAIENAQDCEQGERLKRVRAASVFRATLSKGKVAIPREVVWLLQRDNERERDVTLVFLDPVVEIWATRRWEEYLAGHLFRGVRQTSSNEK